MTRIFLSIILSVLFISCDESTELAIDPDNDREISKWTYEITLEGGEVYTEQVDLISSRQYTESGEEIVEKTLIASREGEDGIEWKIALSDDGCAYISPKVLMPLIPAFINNLYTEVNLATGFHKNEDFYCVDSSNIEKVTVLHDGEVVDADIGYFYTLTAEYAGEALFKVGNEAYTVSTYLCSIEFYEKLMKPEDLTYENGEKVRNRSNVAFTVWWSDKLYFVRSEMDGYLRVLKDIE